MGFNETQVSSDLSRSFDQYFRARGGPVPLVPSEIIPVVLLDDLTRGPYPAGNPFQGGQSKGAVLANFSGVYIANKDPVDQRSAVVVDRIYARAFAAADYHIGVLRYVAFNPDAGEANCETCDQARLPNPVDAPRIGNVNFGTVQLAALVLNILYPGSASPSEFQGPWILGPQEAVLIYTTTANLGITATFRGRYYPPS